MKHVALAGLALALFAAGPGVMVAQATPVYAQKERKACNFCHLADAGAGPRGFRGLFYAAKGHSFKGFDEKKEAKAAGVKAGAVGKAAKPTKPYPPTKK
ncbi:MAG TPA: hypothetical protein PLL78_01260 [Fimbriimonadaceae bacterium]|nr:hypothetical protein [Fimbriimonadaceae bacterium]